MAQYDVYALAGVSGYVVDCQSDLLRELATRVVIPLTPATELTVVMARLYPRFQIQGADYFLNTPLIASLSRHSLRDPITSLIDHDYRIVAAIDALQIGV